MAGGLRKLGSAFVELFVDKSKFSTGLNEAKQEVSQSTEKMGRDVKKNVTEQFEESIKPVNKLRATISKTILLVGSLVVGLASVAGAVISVSKSALGMNKAFSDSLTTIQGLQDQIRVMGLKLSGVYDEQSAQIDALKKQIASIATETIKQQREQAATLDKIVNPDLISPESATLMDGVVKAAADTVRIVSGLTGAGEGLLRDIDAASKAQKDAIDKAVEQMVKQLGDLEEKVAADRRKRIVDAALREHELIQREYDQRYENERKFHAERMRLQSEYYNKLRGQFGDLSGLRALSELPDIIRRVGSRI